VVAEPVPPYRGIELTTEARLVRDGVSAVVERVAIRYLGEARGRRYAEPAPDDIVVRLQPGRLRAWDFSDTPLWPGGPRGSRSWLSRIVRVFDHDKLSPARPARRRGQRRHGALPAPALVPDPHRRRRHAPHLGPTRALVRLAEMEFTVR
jgi:hypothetical protein